MDSNKVEEIYKEAIEIYGIDKQTDKWHEEAGELMQAINKYKLNPTPENLDHVYEEIIDVEIMTGQLKSKIPEDRKQYWFNLKIARLQCKIEKEKERRANYLVDLKNNNPQYFELFKMINEIGPNPLNSQMDDLTNLVLKQQKQKITEVIKNNYKTSR